MTNKATIVTRKRGRPRKEESTAIALEQAILNSRMKLAELTPKAFETLEGLLKSGTEKVKETTAKFIINEAKEVYNIYIAEENEDNAVGGTTSANAEAHKGASEAFLNDIPLTTQIREYAKTGTDDEDYDDDEDDDE